jgi:hypothetical protein
MNPSERVAVVVSARAAISSYIVLAGIWIVLAVVYAGLAFATRGHGMNIGGLVALGVGLIWVAWLRGFRLEVGEGKLEYRDGLYKSVAVPLSEIREVKSAWVEWRILGRTLRVPRLIIVYGPQSNRLSINTKPFRRHDIQLAIDLLRKSTSAN